VDKNNLTPESIADHLAKLLAKPLPKKPPKLKKDNKKKGKRKKGATPVDTPPPSHLTIQLFGTHRVNGYPYGPGTVTLPRELALMLQTADQRARHYDDNWQRPKAVIIGPNRGRGHTATQVPMTTFDQPNLEVPEAGFAHGDGGFTNA
jgi:hypothetical protein